MAKVLATDLDGTLFYPKRSKTCICKKNILFLQKWIDEGNKLLLVTSRSHQFTERLDKEINRPYDVVNNTAAQIYIDGKCVRNEHIDNQKLKEFLDSVDKQYKPLCFLMTTKDWSIIINDNGRISKFFQFIYKIYWFFLFSYREKYIISNDVFNSELDHGEVHKIMIFFGFRKNKNKISKEINKKIRESFSDVEASWIGPVNEITPLNCSKAAGIDFYAKYKNIDPKDIYVVGDSGNDISMFNKYYENSYCMKHGYPSVKKYAHYQISRVYKLEKVLKGENNE